MDQHHSWDTDHFFGFYFSCLLARVGGNMASSKTFDMAISLRNRTDSASDYSFTGLAKDDAGPIKAYLQERKVRVKDTTEEETALLADDLSDEDEDDDSGSDSDGGASRNKKKAPAAKVNAMDEDEDESGKCWLAAFGLRVWSFCVQSDNRYTVQ